MITYSARPPGPASTRAGSGALSMSVIATRSAATREAGSRRARGSAKLVHFVASLYRRAVYAGDGSLSPPIARRLIALVAGHGDPGAARQQAGQRLALLTSREHDVAQSIAQGLSNAQIARELHVSVATVKAHVSRLLTKLDLDNRVQIALLVHHAAASPPGPPPSLR
jgi:DNA-binding CsgD family transcriptional regulator